MTTSDDGTSKFVQGTEWGKLDVSDPERPTLIISGRHLLRGEIKTLHKPMALLKKGTISSTLRKRKRVPDDDGDEDEDMNEDTEEGQQKCLEILCLIKKKIVFSKRPEPIVNGVGGGGGTIRIS